MTKAQANLQDGFLNLLRKENVPVTVFLVNGYQLKGQIRGFDSFTVAVEGEGKIQLVYKHALSTITPMRPLPMTIAQLMRGEEGQETEQGA
ncbi:host factor-I protein [Symbiobacterium terraclitae]|uniref:RNA-binding protein Hfq n=1 Tax=Symbiobacterium terraclitae TaxID=557451 RepID=A0ABS4JMN4_9FIRM|nr:host factor-I protein [Symbiobacterium terraclitae]